MYIATRRARLEASEAGFLLSYIFIELGDHRDLPQGFTLTGG